MRIAISGVTLSGNLGGAAMLAAVRQEVLRRFPESDIALLSINPARDRAASLPARLRVVPAHWLALVALFLPISLAAAPLRRATIVRRLLSRIPYFKALLESTVLVDISGIAFVDGRGPALLAYNVACCAPAFLLGVPVVKLAQTLGPFRERLNRRVARWALSRCAAVVARGSRSGRHLAELGLRDPLVLPDVAFCLDVPAEASAAARLEMERLGLGARPLLLSPSRVLQRSCARHGIDLAGVLSGVIAKMREAGREVALLAHSQAAGIAKNDDSAVCEAILARLPAGARPPVLVTTDPVHARALIGEAGTFVGCRYHSLVSAYGMGVPSIALSWNHKYDDLAELFDQGSWLLTAADIAIEPLVGRLELLSRAADSIRAELQARIPNVVQAAGANFSVLERVTGAQGR